MHSPLLRLIVLVCVSHVAAVLRMRASQQHRQRREQSVRQLQRNSFVSAR